MTFTNSIQNTTSSEYLLQPWVLDNTNCPRDELQFLQAVVYLNSHPDWTTRDDARLYSDLLAETRTSNSPIGIQAREIQNCVIQKHPILFDAVLCRVQNLQIEPRAIPKTSLIAMSELFARGLSAGMQEARTNEWNLVAEEGIGEDDYTKFLHFLAHKEVQITGDNALALLRLAISNRVPLLEDYCVAFIKEHIDLKDVENCRALLALTGNYSSGIECICNLKWHLLCHAYEHLDDTKVATIVEGIDKSCQERCKILLQLGTDCKHFDIKVAFELKSEYVSANTPVFVKSNLRAVTLSSHLSLTDTALEHLAKINHHVAITGLLTSLPLKDRELMAISQSCGNNLLEFHSTHNSQITGFMFRNFPKLIGLSIRSCQLTNDGLKQLRHSLQELTIDGCLNITKIPSKLCTQLVRLGAIKTGLKSSALAHLGSVCKDTLQELRIGYCDRITNLRGFQFSTLKKLNLSHTEISNTDLLEISQVCGNYLEELDINSCENITTLIGCEFRALVKLKIGGDRAFKSSISDRDMSHLSGICSKTLKELDISYCKNVTILQGFTLEVLKAEYSSLNNEGMLAISQSSGDSLQLLDISGCKITQLHGRNFRYLRELHMIESPMENNEMQALSQSSGHILQVLNINMARKITLLGCHFINMIELDAAWSGVTSEGLEELRIKSKHSLKKVTFQTNVNL